MTTPIMSVPPPALPSEPGAEEEVPLSALFDDAAEQMSGRLRPRTDVLQALYDEGKIGEHWLAKSSNADRREVSVSFYNEAAPHQKRIIYQTNDDKNQLVLEVDNATDSEVTFVSGTVPAQPGKRKSGDPSAMYLWFENLATSVLDSVTVTEDGWKTRVATTSDGDSMLVLSRPEGVSNVTIDPGTALTIPLTVEAAEAKTGTRDLNVRFFLKGAEKNFSALSYTVRALKRTVSPTLAVDFRGSHTVVSQKTGHSVGPTSVLLRLNNTDEHHPLVRKPDQGWSSPPVFKVAMAVAPNDSNPTAGTLMKEANFKEVTCKPYNDEAKTHWQEVRKVDQHFLLRPKPSNQGVLPKGGSAVFQLEGIETALKAGTAHVFVYVDNLAGFESGAEAVLVDKVLPPEIERVDVGRETVEHGESTSVRWEVSFPNRRNLRSGQTSLYRRSATGGWDKIATVDPSGERSVTPLGQRGVDGPAQTTEYAVEASLDYYSTGKKTVDVQVFPPKTVKGVKNNPVYVQVHGGIGTWTFGNDPHRIWPKKKRVKGLCVRDMGYRKQQLFALVEEAGSDAYLLFLNMVSAGLDVSRTRVENARVSPRSVSVPAGVIGTADPHTQRTAQLRTLYHSGALIWKRNLRDGSIGSVPIRAKKDFHLTLERLSKGNVIGRFIPNFYPSGIPSYLVAGLDDTRALLLTSSNVSPSATFWGPNKTVRLQGDVSPVDYYFREDDIIYVDGTDSAIYSQPHTEKEPTKKIASLTEYGGMAIERSTGDPVWVDKTDPPVIRRYVSDADTVVDLQHVKGLQGEAITLTANATS